MKVLRCHWQVYTPGQANYSPDPNAFFAAINLLGEVNIYSGVYLGCHGLDISPPPLISEDCDVAPSLTLLLLAVCTPRQYSDVLR